MLLSAILALPGAAAAEAVLKERELVLTLRRRNGGVHPQPADARPVGRC